MVKTVLLFEVGDYVRLKDFDTKAESKRLKGLANDVTSVEEEDLLHKKQLLEFSLAFFDEIDPSGRFRVARDQNYGDKEVLVVVNGGRVFVPAKNLRLANA